MFEAFRVQVTGKGVRQTDIGTIGGFLVRCVSAYIADEQIDKAIVVVIDEHSAGRMRNQVQSGGFAHVCKVSVTIVLKKDIAAQDGADKEIRMSRIIHVGERGAYADTIRETDSSLLGNIPELTASQILPQLISADLVYKIDVVQAISVDVGNGKPGSVVIMNRQVLGTGIHCHVVHEGDAALFELVLKVKVVKHLELCGRF